MCWPRRDQRTAPRLPVATGRPLGLHSGPVCVSPVTVQIVHDFTISDMAINGRSRNWKKVFHEQLEEDAVEDTWRRRHRPLMNTALDNFGVESVAFRPSRGAMSI